MRKYKIATILFYTDEKEVLIQDRRSISKYGEEWGFFGGKIKKGETPRQAIVREVKEELAHDLSDFEKLGEIEVVQEHEFKSNIHIYIKNITRKDAEEFTVLEGDGAEFVSISELKKKKMLIGMDRIICMFEKFIF